MAEMPTLGRQPRRPARGAIFAVVVVTAALGGWLWTRHRAPPPPPMVAAPVAPPSASPAIAATTPLPEPAAAHDGAVAAAAPSLSPKPVDDPLKRAGLRLAHVSISGPLETALVTQLGTPLGRALTPVVVRTLVWWVNIPDDLRRGDELIALFEERSSAEPLVSAVRFKSEKAQRSFRAYRYRGDDEQAHFYLPDGRELEPRLKESPIDEYDQITSLLADGRGHKGVDFRTPVGTAVKAPFDGEVVRTNWNFRGNGNSVEIREAGGAHHHALFLHLSETLVARGARVHKGQVVAKSGNTGHSFAPHLHYQLMSASGQVLDPFHVHALVHRTLPADQKEAFEAEVRRLDALIDGAITPSRAAGGATGPG